MRLSMQLNYAGDIESTVKQVVELEKVGLDLVFIAELYSFDAPSLMGYLAARTERIQIAAGILPIYSRTPTLIAMTAAGIDSVSGGRCVMGLGSSGPQVIEGWHGVPFDAPVGRTREIIEICRLVWKRERVTYDGRYYQLPLPQDQGTGLGKPLKILNHPVRESIPLWVAALGPKNVEMTAEIADGWLPIFYMPEKADQVWGGPLKSGLDKRSPDLGPLDVAAGGMVAIGDEVDGYKDFARPLLALYVGGMGAKGKNFYNTLVSSYGYEAEATAIQDLYLDGKKQEAAAEVPEELIEHTNLIGPEGFVRERVAAYAEAGVTYLNVQPLAMASRSGEDANVAVIDTLRGMIDDL